MNRFHPAAFEGVPASMPLSEARASTSVYVVDHAPRRRAELLSGLYAEGIVATPLEPEEAPAVRCADFAVFLYYDGEPGAEGPAPSPEPHQAAALAIYYSDRICLHRVVEAMQRGGIGYFEWPGEKAEAIRCVGETIAALSAYARRPTVQSSDGESLTGWSAPQAIAARIKQVALRTHAAARLARLTPREREVLRLMAQGLSSAEIAGRLGISQKTVNAHRGNIMVKLGARSLADEIRWAIEGGLT